MNSSGPHLVLTSHGIRTFGVWQQTLERLVKDVRPDIEFYNFKFNFFSFLAFVMPWSRWLIVRRFRAELRAIVRTKRPSRVDFVGHSFGTHVMSFALKRLRDDEDIRVHTMILAGSVLRCDFPAYQLLSSRVGRIVNDCGTKDGALIWSQFLVLFTGMAGRLGLVGMTGEGLLNRYSAFGHSGYFCDQHLRSASTYMREHWVPLLTSEEPPTRFDARVSTTSVQGAKLWLINNLEPLKIALYTLPLLLGLLFFAGLSLSKTLAEERVSAIHDVLKAAADRPHIIFQEERTSSYQVATREFLDYADVAAQLPFQRTFAIWLDNDPKNNILERRSLEKYGIIFYCVTTTQQAVDLVKGWGKDHTALIIADYYRNSNDTAGHAMRMVEAFTQAGVEKKMVIYMGNVRHIKKGDLDEISALGLAAPTDSPYHLFRTALGTVTATNKTDGGAGEQLRKIRDAFGYMLARTPIGSLSKSVRACPDLASSWER